MVNLRMAESLPQNAKPRHIGRGFVNNDRDGKSALLEAPVAQNFGNLHRVQCCALA